MITCIKISDCGSPLCPLQVSQSQSFKMVSKWLSNLLKVCVQTCSEHTITWVTTNSGTAKSQTNIKSCSSDSVFSMLLFKTVESSVPSAGTSPTSLQTKIWLSARNNSKCYWISMIKCLTRSSTFWDHKSTMEAGSQITKTFGLSRQS